MDDVTIRQRVRAMLQTGQLPCEDSAGIWAGKGDGKWCGACAEPITGEEVEFEVVLTSGATILLHRACHAIWLDECEPGTATPRESARATP
jgi:hypothetical protein